MDDENNDFCRLSAIWKISYANSIKSDLSSKSFDNSFYENQVVLYRYVKLVKIYENLLTTNVISQTH